MKNYCCVLVSILLLFSSCKNCIDYNGASVIMVKNIDKGEFDWMSVINVKNVIPLEMTDKSLLGLAQKCLIKNNHVLFLDYKMKIVYIFDLTGQFLYCIDSQGGGNEEYIELIDANFNYDGTQVIIMDQRSLVFYDANDGHFLKKMSLDIDTNHSFYKFINIDKDHYYFFSTVGDYTLYQYSNDCFVGIRDRKSYQLVYERFHCQKNNSCLLAPDYGFYNIDEITKSGINPKYYIDFGNMVIPESELPRNSREFDKVDKGNYFKSIVGVKENDFAIYIQSVGPNNSYCEIYVNKSNGSIMTGVPDTKTGLFVVDVNSTSFYALVYPDYITEQSGFYKRLKKYIHEEGNPILLELSVNEPIQCGISAKSKG